MPFKEWGSALVNKVKFSMIPAHLAASFSSCSERSFAQGIRLGLTGWELKIEIQSNFQGCKRFLFQALLPTFWNCWWSMQSDWLSLVQLVHKFHLFCSKSHLFPSLLEPLLKHNNQSYFEACSHKPIKLEENETQFLSFINQLSTRSIKYFNLMTTKILYLSSWILQFMMDAIKYM